MNAAYRPQEHALEPGEKTGRLPKAGLPAASSAAHAVAHARAQGASLGTARLGTGANVIALLATFYGLLLFSERLAHYPNLFPIIAAWLLFLAAFATILVRILVRGEHLPGWLSGVYLSALAVVVALELVAIWPLHDLGRFASVSMVVGFGLLIIVTLRPAREILVAAGLLAVVLAGAALALTGISAANLPNQLATIAIAAFPGFVGVYIVRHFRTSVQLELDRVLIQSTVTAPRFVVGMLASEELARLDLAAETLLDSVATGRSPLPLTATVSATAAALATELRLHLIEGRRETWLYHAMLESNQLGSASTLHDPGSLAGLLNPVQRDGLLSAIWLLVVDNQKTKLTARLSLGPVKSEAAPTHAPPTRGSRRTIVVPISITTTGVPRSRIDPTIWAAIAKVGVSVESTENHSLRIDIECVVPNPANH